MAADNPGFEEAVRVEMAGEAGEVKDASEAAFIDGPVDRVVAVPALLEHVHLGERIALPGSPDLQALGRALHGPFAADDPAAPRSGRLELARGLLERWGVAQLGPAAALAAS